MHLDGQDVASRPSKLHKHIGPIVICGCNPMRPRLCCLLQRMRWIVCLNPNTKEPCQHSFDRRSLRVSSWDRRLAQSFKLKNINDAERGWDQSVYICVEQSSRVCCRNLHPAKPHNVHRENARLRYASPPRPRNADCSTRCNCSSSKAFAFQLDASDALRIRGGLHSKAIKTGRPHALNARLVLQAPRRMAQLNF